MTAEALFHSPAGALALLLLAGHVLGDFYLQWDGLVAAKQRHPAWGAQLRHAGIVALATGVVLAPFVPWRAALAAAAVTLVAHFLVDVLKQHAAARGWSPFRAFVVDQVGHLAVIAALVAAARWWWPGLPAHAYATNLLPGAPLPLPAAWLDTGRVVLAFLLCGKPGAVLVADLLRGLGPAAAGEAAAAGAADLAPADDAAPAIPAGRLVGILERFLALALLLAGAWGALGLVIAAKSIVRFRRFEHDEAGDAFAEQFLVGTLASLLVALAAFVLAR